MQAHRPMDSVRFIHRVLRTMLNGMEQTAANADYANDQQVGAIAGQFQGVNMMLGEHIKQEDELIFPSLEKRVREVIPSYSADHTQDRELLTKMGGLLADLPKTPAAQRGALGKQAYRTAVVINCTSDHHMQKEEAIVYPLINKHVGDDEQWAIIRQLYARLPVQMFPMAMPGMMRLLDQEEREEQVRDFMKAMTPETFKAAIAHAPKGMSPAEWSDLQRRIPELGRV